jgi:hypothetical protein
MLDKYIDNLKLLLLLNYVAELSHGHVHGGRFSGRPYPTKGVDRNDEARQRAYGVGMIPTVVAIPIALLRFASLACALAWMASSSERPGRA